MEMTETQEIGLIRSVRGASEAGNWLWVVVERIVLKKPTNMAPSVLFKRKRKDTDTIGIHKNAAWGRCFDLKIWRSTSKASPGVWFAVGDEESATRFHLTPNEHPLTFIGMLDERRAPYGSVYRAHVFFTEHYARCYLERKNPGKGRDGDV